MAAGVRLQLPTAGPHLLRASHFTLGPDARLHMGAALSTAHRDFPPYPDVAPAPPSAPPPRATLFQQDARWAREERVSEAHAAFVPQLTQSRELERARRLAMQASHLHLHADPRGRAGRSTTRADFQWPQLPERGSQQSRGARLIFHRDSVPLGHGARLPFAPTTHQALFPPRDARPQPRASCRHLGERPHAPRRLRRPEALEAGGARHPPPGDGWRCLGMGLVVAAGRGVLLGCTGQPPR